MSETDDKIDLLTRLSKFHDDVSELEYHTRMILTFLGKADFGEAVKHFHIFFQNALIYHFSFEEKIVFPAIQVWSQKPKLVELISEYRAFHRNMLEEGSAVSELLVNAEEHPETISVQDVAESLAQLSGKLLQHARHENMRIIPLLSDNSSLRFLIGRNYYLFKNEAQKYFYDTPE